MSASWRAWVAAASIAVGLGAVASAQTTLSEPQLKAAFVLNFVRYTEWPERAFAAREAPVVICVVGRDRNEAAIGDLEGRQVQGRPVKVRRGVDIDDSRGCHVAFIGESEARRLAMTVRGFGGRPVLTISDIDGFIDSGGAIGIVRGDDRLQFEINRGALEQAQLKASSQLLKLARAVLGGGS